MRNAAIATIETAFLAGWSPAPLFPVQMGNSPFTQPKNAPWGRFTVVLGARNPAAVGPRFGRTLGMIYLQVFTPIDAGGRNGVKAADKLDEIYRFHVLPFTDGPTSATVNFEAGAEGPTPTTNQDGFAAANVVLSFRIDDDTGPA